MRKFAEDALREFKKHNGKVKTEEVLMLVLKMLLVHNDKIREANAQCMLGPSTCPAVNAMLEQSKSYFAAANEEKVKPEADIKMNMRRERVKYKVADK